MNPFLASLIYECILDRSHFVGENKGRSDHLQLLIAITALFITEIIPHGCSRRKKPMMHNKAMSGLSLNKRLAKS
jgi:hypothetical protein